MSDTTLPSLYELSKALREHPALLWSLIQDLNHNPPQVAGPWVRTVLEDSKASAMARHRTNGRILAYVKAVWVSPDDPEIMFGPHTHVGPHTTQQQCWEAVVRPVGLPENLGTFPSQEEARSILDECLRKRKWTLL